jgi:hypothetical protein
VPPTAGALLQQGPRAVPVLLVTTSHLVTPGKRVTAVTGAVTRVLPPLLQSSSVSMKQQQPGAGVGVGGVCTIPGACSSGQEVPGMQTVRMRGRLRDLPEVIWILMWI